MTQDEIIRMAQQVQDEGFAPVGIWPEVRRLCELAFAAGAAHEREACAKVCEQGTGDAVQTETLKLLLQERWRIASVIRGLK